MNAKSSPVVYLTPSNAKECEAFRSLLEPYSWAIGEFGLMLTNVAFAESVEDLSTGAENENQAFLKAALSEVQKMGAGDVCLNFGIVN